jgi:glycosyltransferase involved in cell wall biosynthesis
MNPAIPKEINLSTTWVVVAAYNEGPAVGEVVMGLKEHDFKVVVVDDGSTDDTSAAARDAGAVVVQHPINLGQGAALQTGIDFALRRGAQFIVTFDADGQHRALDVPVLISALVDTGADIACGSRFLGRAENLSRTRRIMLELATVFTYLTTGLQMTDAHNGLRAMTRHCAMRIRLRQNRMAHASEIINEIARLKLRFIEVPVTICYSTYSLQKGQKLSNSINIVLDLIMRKLHR